MQRFYNFILLLIISLSCTAQTKEELTIQVINKVSNVDDIFYVLDIAKKYKNIYDYIPTMHPIAPKNKPYITSQFGKRFHPIDKVYKFHSGIDFKAQFATSIHSTAKGKVIFVGNKGGYGKCVIIDHNFGFQTIYAHLTAYYVKPNTQIEKGQIIGFLGNTGKSTGAHLHYEIKKNNKVINPTKFINL